MKLYGYWRSSAAWRVRIALGLKGLAYDNAPVDLRAGGQNAPSHAARNPFEQVPVLEWTTEAGEVQRLTQSMAILAWLDLRVPTPALFPTDPMVRIRALELAEVVNSGIHPVQNSRVLADVAALGGSRETWARTIIERGLGALQTLAAPVSGAFLVGDSVTVADLTLVPQLYNARRYGVDLAPFGRLTEIEGRCSALPAFAAAHPDQQPDAF